MANDFDLEFGGDDILHVYNKAQVKHRLNTAAMYIANTKVPLYALTFLLTQALNSIHNFLGFFLQIFFYKFFKF